MNSTFTPTFRHFQNDIERYLKGEGKCETNEFGQTVFRGYEAAVPEMFEEYMEFGALAPLVAEFRSWNWEWGVNDYLERLASRLKEADDWPHLFELLSAVVAKRKTNYNKTKKARNAAPAKIPEALVIKTRDLLLESLHRLCDAAAEFRREAEVAKFAAMIPKVERGLAAR